MMQRCTASFAMRSSLRGVARRSIGTRVAVPHHAVVQPRFLKQSPSFVTAPSCVTKCPARAYSAEAAVATQQRPAQKDKPASSAGITVQEIEEVLMASSLKPTYVKVSDFTNVISVAFMVYIVSPSFVDVPVLERHKTVKEILAEQAKKMHNLIVVTRTPEQYAEEKPQGFTL